jgi:hypothetical protein
MEEVACTKCHGPISEEYYNAPDFVPCPSCHAPIKVDLFPAFFRGLRPGKAAEVLLDDQASCFYHPQKKAVLPCDHCGRFLCALCDVELGDRHLCPACLDSGKKEGAILNLDRHRVLYDATALRLALFPLILFWVTLITAPFALCFAIRHWNSPGSIIRRTKIRFILAMVFSGLQILGWAAWLVVFVLRG